MVATNGWFTRYSWNWNAIQPLTRSSLSPTVENESRIYLFSWVLFGLFLFVRWTMCVHDFANCTRLSSPLSLSVGGVAVKERTTTTWCNNTPDIELALQHHELLCCCCCRISPIFLFFSLFDVTIFTISWKSDLKVRRMDRFLCCNFCVLFFRERNDGARNLWVGVLFRYFIFPFCWRISF